MQDDYKYSSYQIFSPILRYGAATGEIGVVIVGEAGKTGVYTGISVAGFAGLAVDGAYWEGEGEEDC